MMMETPKIWTAALQIVLFRMAIPVHRKEENQNVPFVVMERKMVLKSVMTRILILPTDVLSAKSLMDGLV